jgi:uncharacterized 2Fe-2S/4Fe-4S cluster protein (DUF4445 family)
MNNAAKEHNVEVETLSKELEVAQEKLKRTVTQMETLKKHVFWGKKKRNFFTMGAIEMVNTMNGPSENSKKKY